MKQVTRKINGQETTLTPTENFVHQAAKRLEILEYQFGLLAKMTGSQYEHTEQHLDVIETAITGFYDAAISALRNPHKTKAKVADKFIKLLQKA